MSNRTSRRMNKMTTNTEKTTEASKISWAVPKELGIPADSLRLRLDFYHQATTITFFHDEIVGTKLVDALDVAHALSSELSFSTGLLPAETLWWQNTRGGPLYALYDAPQTRVLTLQTDLKKPPKRFKVPLPGFLFLCSPGQMPWVFAVKKKPTKETDIVYRAPLANIFNNGRSCPGSHRYPNRVNDMIHSFFVSFFSSTADLRNRSKKFPGNVIALWSFLDGKKKFPLNDLVEHGTIRDLMAMKVN